MSCFYSFMILVLRLARLLFFREVEVSGIECIPPHGEAVIFAGNHPNAMVDPAMLMMYAGRPVKTMAKATVFVGPLAAFFRGLGGIPVYRQMDDRKPPPAANGAEAPTNPTAGPRTTEEAARELIQSPTPQHDDQTNTNGNGTSAAPDATAAATTTAAKPPSTRNRNEDAFREVNDVLKVGGAFAIFPEGLSHSLSQLQELKVGLARMALNFLTSTEKETGTRPSLQIIPVGLTYTSPDEWRSCAWIKFGEGFTVPGPIVDTYASKDKEAQRKAVRELTDIVAAAIRRYTVTAPDWETVELIILSSSLYRNSPPGGHATRPWMCWCCKVEDNYKIPVGSQLYLASMLRQEAVMMIDDAVMNLMRLKVADYNRQLKNLDCTDDDIRIHRDMGVCEVVLSALFYLLVMCFLMPLSIPILLLNLPVLGLAKLAGNIIAAGERDTIATYTIIVAGLLLPVFYGVYIGVFSWVFAYKIDRLMEADNYISVGVWIVFFALMIPTLSFITMRMWEEIWFAKEHCMRLHTLFRYADSVSEAAETRKVCHELVQAMVVLLGSEETHGEAHDAFPDVEMMSREEAYRVIVEFAEANEVDLSQSRMFRLAAAGYSHGANAPQTNAVMDDLREMRSSFFADTNAAHIIDHTSLNEQETLNLSIRQRKTSLMLRQRNNQNSRAPSRIGSARNEQSIVVGGEGEGSGAVDLAATHTLGSGTNVASGSYRSGGASRGAYDPRRVELNVDETNILDMTPIPEEEQLLGTSTAGARPPSRGATSPSAGGGAAAAGATSPSGGAAAFGNDDTHEDRLRQDETAARYGVFHQRKGSAGGGGGFAGSGRVDRE